MNNRFMFNHRQKLNASATPFALVSNNINTHPSVNKTIVVQEAISCPAIGDIQKQLNEQYSLLTPYFEDCYDYAFADLVAKVDRDAFNDFRGIAAFERYCGPQHPQMTLNFSTVTQLSAIEINRDDFKGTLIACNYQAATLSSPLSKLESQICLPEGCAFPWNGNNVMVGAYLDDANCVITKDGFNCEFYRADNALTGTWQAKGSLYPAITYNHFNNVFNATVYGYVHSSNLVVASCLMTISGNATDTCTYNMPACFAELQIERTTAALLNSSTTCQNAFGEWVEKGVGLNVYPSGPYDIINFIDNDTITIKADFNNLIDTTDDSCKLVTSLFRVQPGTAEFLDAFGNGYRFNATYNANLIGKAVAVLEQNCHLNLTGTSFLPQQSLFKLKLNQNCNFGFQALDLEIVTESTTKIIECVENIALQHMDSCKFVDVSDASSLLHCGNPTPASNNAMSNLAVLSLSVGAGLLASLIGIIAYSAYRKNQVEQEVETPENAAEYKRLLA